MPLKWVLRRKRLVDVFTTMRPDEINWTTLAAECNYTDQAHFSREFKAVTGLSPSEYRRLHRLR